MKKLLYLMPLALLIGSCSADEPMFQYPILVKGHVSPL